jgi:Flp pilus assembly protein TadD
MDIHRALQSGSYRTIFCCCLVVEVLAGCVLTGGAEKQTSYKATLRDAAIVAHQSLDYEAAATHYRSLYERDPDDTAALLGAARNLRYSGSSSEAIDVMVAGISDHGQIPAFVLELSKSQITSRHFDEARKNLEVALKLLPDDWDVLSTTGIFNDYLGEFDAAQSAYNAALEFSPNNVAVINNLALSLAQSGKLEAGIAILAKLVNDEKSTPHTRQNLAMLYALAGDIKSAEELIRQDLSENAAIENLTAFKQMH